MTQCPFTGVTIECINCNMFNELRCQILREYIETLEFRISDIGNDEIAGLVKKHFKDD